MIVQPLKKEERMITVELHQAEINLIQRIRDKYQYGEITIEIKDGLPNRIVTERHFDKVWL